MNSNNEVGIILVCSLADGVDFISYFSVMFISLSGEEVPTIELLETTPERSPEVAITCGKCFSVKSLAFSHSQGALLICNSHSVYFYVLV